MKTKNIALVGIIILLIIFLKPCGTNAQAVDTDIDDLSDQDEIDIYYTNPEIADTDGDGYNDGLEIKHGYSPLVAGNTKLKNVDTDNDGLMDDWEIKLGTDIKNPDTDGDGYNDGREVKNGYLPTKNGNDKSIKNITVNLTNQHLKYYLGNTELESFAISSGIKRLPTPTGNFTVLAKVPIKNYGGPGFSYPNTKWNLHFTSGKAGRYYIHGAYWHNDFGKPKSHGCVNVSYTNMERLYNWAQTGTSINIIK